MPNISLYDLGAKNIFFRMHGKIGIKNYGHIQFICNSNSRMSRKPIWSIIDQHTKPNHFFNFFSYTKGPSINDVQFFGLCFDLPTPVRFYTSMNFKFYYIVSDFGNTTYLPQNRTSFMDVPQKNL